MSEPAVTSFHLDTSAGGIPITLCACGLLIFQPMARIHLATCAICAGGNCLQGGLLDACDCYGFQPWIDR